MSENVHRTSSDTAPSFGEALEQFDRGDRIRVVYRSRRTDRENEWTGRVTEVSTEKGEDGGYLAVRFIEDGDGPRYTRTEYVLLVNYDPSSDTWENAVGIGRNTPEKSDNRPPDRLDDDYAVVAIEQPE